jgi:hypothetical protein
MAAGTEKRSLRDGRESHRDTGGGRQGANEEKEKRKKQKKKKKENPRNRWPTA